MLTRRRFLGYGSAGMLAATAGCRPATLKGLGNRDEGSGSIVPALSAKAGLADRRKFFLGYPLNLNSPPEEFFAWRRELRKVGIGDFGYNNVGNPFRDSSIAYNTHDLERETILRFGRLYGFAPGEIWGFLSHSGTDSNMHGLYMGRTILKARTGKTPRCYFTREAHYSIQILRDLLGIESVMVDTLPDGGMDSGDLVKRLADHHDAPALVVATLGTTFKGAIDRIDPIQDALQGRQYYLHVDAALFGGYLAHTAALGEMLHRAQGKSGAPRYDSIAVSCHKFFGFPAPAGLFITTKTTFEEFNEQYRRIHDPEYIGQVPGTITCSRDAVKPAEFHFFSSPSAIARQAEDTRSVLQNTDYLLAEMQTHLDRLQPQRANDVSNTIYFRKPGGSIIRKYSLATMGWETDGQRQAYAHVVVMPHASRNVLDEFLTDLAKDSAGLG